MKIKICGLKSIQDIDYVNEFKPDYIGFIFAESRRKISYEQAELLHNHLDKSIKTVGVFVNEDINLILKLIGNNIIDIVQLHGDEDNAYIENLRKKTDVIIIKSVSISDKSSIKNLDKINADYLLFDNGKGGTGTAFDWDLLDKSLNDKIFLAGGINTENIKSAIKLNPFCIDVSSGAETDGIKDKDKIKTLIRSVRNG